MLFIYVYVDKQTIRFCHTLVFLLKIPTPLQVKLHDANALNDNPINISANSYFAVF